MTSPTSAVDKKGTATTNMGMGRVGVTEETTIKIKIPSARGSCTFHNAIEFVLNFQSEAGKGKEAAIMVGHKGAAGSNTTMDPRRQKNRREVRDIENIAVGQSLAVNFQTHGTGAEDRNGLVGIAKFDNATGLGQVLEVVKKHITIGTHDAGGAGVGADDTRKSGTSASKTARVRIKRFF